MAGRAGRRADGETERVLRSKIKMLPSLSGRKRDEPMNKENAFTKRQLVEMWKRPVERQYNVAISKMLEAIRDTKGDITICFSGGKDSALLLDMYCEIIGSTPFAGKPIKVSFADTTNETTAMRKFIADFIHYVEQKHGVQVELETVRPPKKLTWASFVLENGIPLISKEQSKAIRVVKADMRKTGCDYDTVRRLAKPDIKCVNELFDLGFSKTGVLSLTGYVSSRDEFGKMFTLSKKWMPMVCCDIDLTNLCCANIKEAALNKVGSGNRMTGEQAQESKARESVYLKTGCNARMAGGIYVSKPFGAMTQDGVLYAIAHRKTPICPDYGEVVKDADGHFHCTKAQRTGCALCGYGCQYDTERFIRLQKTDPAKVRFAFKPKEQGGAGYKEAIEYMNEHCGTKVIIPEV